MRTFPRLLHPILLVFTIGCAHFDDEAEFIDVPSHPSAGFIVGSWERIVDEGVETATFHADGRFEYTPVGEPGFFDDMPSAGRWSATDRQLTIVYGADDCCRIELSYYADAQAFYPGAFLLSVIERKNSETDGQGERQEWSAKMRHEFVVGGPFVDQIEPELELEQNWWGRGESSYRVTINGTYKGEPEVDILDRGSYVTEGGDTILESGFYPSHPSERLELVADGVLTWAERNTRSRGPLPPSFLWETGFEFRRI